MRCMAAACRVHYCPFIINQPAHHIVRNSQLGMAYGTRSRKRALAAASLITSTFAATEPLTPHYVSHAEGPATPAAAPSQIVLAAAASPMTPTVKRTRRQGHAAEVPTAMTPPGLLPHADAAQAAPVNTLQQVATVQVFNSVEDLQRACDYLRLADPLLAPLIDAHGLPYKLTAHTDVSCFMALAKSIVYQQLSGKAAGTIFGRVLALCGTPASASLAVAPLAVVDTQALGAVASAQAAASTTGHESGATGQGSQPDAAAASLSPGCWNVNGATAAVVPAAAVLSAGGNAASASAAGVAVPDASPSDRVLTPASILATDPVALRGCGLSEQKIKYLVGLAAAFTPGNMGRTLTDEIVRGASDDALISMLTELKGVGAWTAHMLAIMNLGRPDVLPTGDLAVRKGMQALYKLPALPTPTQMTELAERWRPYRSIGSWLMWRVPEASLPARSTAGKKHK